jgi:hypothetical protein
VNAFSYTHIYGSDNSIVNCIFRGLRKAKCHICFFLAACCVTMLAVTSRWNEEEICWFVIYGQSILRLSFWFSLSSKQIDGSLPEKKSTFLRVVIKISLGVKKTRLGAL